MSLAEAAACVRQAASPLHRKRVRSGLALPLNGVSGDGSAQRPFPEPAAAPAAAMPDCDQARSRGMQLLFCAADELDNGTRRAGGAAARARHCFPTPSSAPCLRYALMTHVSCGTGLHPPLCFFACSIPWHASGIRDVA